MRRWRTLDVTPYGKIGAIDVSVYGKMGGVGA